MKQRVANLDPTNPFSSNMSISLNYNSQMNQRVHVANLVVTKPFLQQHVYKFELRLSNEMKSS